MNQNENENEIVEQQDVVRKLKAFCEIENPTTSGEMVFQHIPGSNRELIDFSKKMAELASLFCGIKND